MSPTFHENWINSRIMNQPSWRACGTQTRGPGGSISKPGQTQLPMVIRVKLFIHKPCQSNANWYGIVTHRPLCYSCFLSCKARGWIARLTITMPIGPGWVFEILPPDVKQKYFKAAFILILRTKRWFKTPIQNSVNSGYCSSSSEPERRLYDVI